MNGKLILAGLLVSLPLIANAATDINASVNQQSQSAATNEANQQSITFNSSAPSEVTNKVDYGGSFKTVPNVFAPSISTTAPCIVGFSGGVSALGGGIAVGTGKEDVWCTNRENARLLYSFGEHKGAVAVLCQNPNVKASMPARCEEALAEVPVQPIIKEVVKEVPVVKQVEVVKYIHVKPKPLVKPRQCKLPCTITK